ncbi:MAG: hypothetical protein HYZ28_01230 [Myxococcales bacterium]|nr:hypothetical protein [Myxococcales bacterium]
MLRGADGGYLAHSPALVAASSTGPVAAETLGFGVVFSAPDGGAPSKSTVLLSIDGGVLGSAVVNAERADAVRSLELIVLSSGGPFVLKATARIDGGAVLWQAPVEWSWDPPLQYVDFQERLGLEPMRRDFLFLSPADAGPGTYLVSVTARVGAAAASVSSELIVPEPTQEEPPPEVPPPPPPRCGCAQSEGIAVLAVVAAAGLAAVTGTGRRGQARRRVMR